MLKRCALWLRNGFVRGRSLNATRIVAASFAIIILLGALLLTLPIASRGRAERRLFYRIVHRPPPPAAHRADPGGHLDAVGRCLGRW